MGGPNAADNASPSRVSRLVRMLEGAGIVALLALVAWLAFRSTLGDRSTAMVVALSATFAVCAALMSRAVENGARRGIATAAFGATPVVAFATLRGLSEPLMGSAFTDSAAKQREGLESVVIAVVLAGFCAALAGWVGRRPDAGDGGRGGRWLIGAMTWAPLLIVPIALGMIFVEGWPRPAPAEYGMAQPVLAHMNPVSEAGEVVVDELEREEGITLVRVCEDKPWCHTLLRRGDKVSARPGLVARSAQVHLRYDAAHALYLVESGGELVATINAETLASYTTLLPHHVRRSLAPPRAYQWLAALGVAFILLMLWKRSRLRVRRADAIEGEVGVCFGDGWGLLADGTAMRVPPDMGRGSILVMWSKGKARSMTILEGTREAIAERFARRRQALDAAQLVVSWTLCTPLFISVAVV